MGYLNRSAIISEDGLYRYHLSRTWGDDERAVFIMLNPSTADGFTDDATIRRCIAFAKAWKLDGIEVVNLYAYRATHPQELWTVNDPVGPDNDRWLRSAGTSGYPLIAAWGNHARQDRVSQVLAMPGFEKLTCLKTTRSAAPAHPLRLSADLTPVPWPGVQG